MSAPHHCDDYLDDPTAPEVLRRFLELARSPAHGMVSPVPIPALYADHAGRRVRVTMASRFGDVGITTDFTRAFGYQVRVMLAELANFGDAP
jgi:hypothetical protein